MRTAGQLLIVRRNQAEDGLKSPAGPKKIVFIYLAPWI